MMDAEKIRKMSDADLEFFLLGVEECERILREQIDNLRTELMDVTLELEELKEKHKGCFRFGKPKKMEFPNYGDVDTDI